MNEKMPKGKSIYFYSDSIIMHVRQNIFMVGLVIEWICLIAEWWEWQKHKLFIFACQVQNYIFAGLAVCYGRPSV